MEKWYCSECEHSHHTYSDPFLGWMDQLRGRCKCISCNKRFKLESGGK